jgi:alpha-glucosidase
MQASKHFSVFFSYRLLDYLYTAFHRSHMDGTPVLHPVWFKYPKDPNTYALDHQFFFGDSILVSPVTDDDATSVSIYLPRDTFYDFATLAPVQSAGSTITLGNVNFTQIPLHIKGGVVLPLRAQSAMTTKALRKKDFEFVVAPNARGEASGSLYIDDGESLVQAASTQVEMAFMNGKLDVWGSFGFATGVNVSRIRFLAVSTVPKAVLVDGKNVDASQVSYDSANQVLDISKVGVIHIQPTSRAVTFP